MRGSRGAHTVMGMLSNDIVGGFQTNDTRNEGKVKQ
jgi:hypothetical protein